MSAPISSKIPSRAEQINPPLVRTLSPPPEIWELVHPVESNNNPRLNFVGRTKLSATSFILIAMVIGLFLGVSIAVLRLRGVQKESSVEALQPVQLGATPSGDQTANPANSSAPPSVGTATQQTDTSLTDIARQASSSLSQQGVRDATGAEQPELKAETTTGVRNSPAPARSEASATGVRNNPAAARFEVPATGVRSDPASARSEVPATDVRNDPAPPVSGASATGTRTGLRNSSVPARSDAPPTVDKTRPAPARSEAPASDGATGGNKKSSSDPATAKSKPNTSPSPQVVTPTKSDTERKAKVIQWP